MKHEPIFNWNAETGTAVCILTDGEKVHTGIAQCHSEDMDMCGEKTGCEIAFRRAKINALKVYRDELKVSLKALNQLYYTMNKSNKFNEKSYENKMLQRQINRISFDLTTIKETINDERKSLKEYLEEKEKFYVKIRSLRAKGKNN